MKNSSSRKALFPAFKKLFNSLKVYPVCMYLGEVYQGVIDIILVHSIEKIQLIFLSKEPDKCFYYFYVSYRQLRKEFILRNDMDPEDKILL